MAPQTWGRREEEATTRKLAVWLVKAAFSAVGGDFGVPSGEAEPRKTSPENSASQRTTGELIYQHHTQARLKYRFLGQACPTE